MTTTPKHEADQWAELAAMVTNGQVATAICPPEIIAYADCRIKALEAENAELRARVAELEAQRVALTKERVRSIMAEAGYSSDRVNPQERADFINGLRCGEKAHGIGLEVKP